MVSGRKGVGLFGVELVIANKFVNPAVILVGPALRGHVNLAGCVTEFGRVNPALHFELLQHVHIGQNEIRVEIRIGVGHPVQRVIVPGRARAGDGHVLRRPVAALPDRRLPLAGESRRHVRA